MTDGKNFGNLQENLKQINELKSIMDGARDSVKDIAVKLAEQSRKEGKTHDAEKIDRLIKSAENGNVTAILEFIQNECQ